MKVSKAALPNHPANFGFCWLDWFDPDQVRKILNIPEEYEVVAVAPIGFAAKEGRPSPKNLQKK